MTIIVDAIKNSAMDLWYYISLQFVDPFWWWLIAGCLFILVVTASIAGLNYFFGDTFKWLRPTGGVAIILAIFGLFAYRKGEKDARAHDKPIPKPKPKPIPQDEPPWRPW